MKLLQVPADIIDQVWEAASPFIDKAVKYSRGTHSTESARDRAKANNAQLWVIVEDEKPHTIKAAGLTSITEYPTGKRALMIELLGGEHMKDWFTLKRDVEVWAKNNGCELSFCWARKGWAKHINDYQITHYMMMKELQ